MQRLCRYLHVKCFYCTYVHALFCGLPIPYAISELSCTSCSKQVFVYDLCSMTEQNRFRVPARNFGEWHREICPWLPTVYLHHADQYRSFFMLFNERKHRKQSLCHILQDNKSLLPPCTTSSLNCTLTQTFFQLIKGSSHLELEQNEDSKCNDFVA